VPYDRRQYVIHIPDDFRGLFTARVDDHMIVTNSPDDQPTPWVETVRVTEDEDPETQYIDSILRRLVNYSADTREAVLDTYRAACEAGWEVSPPKRGTRAQLWISRGNAKLGLNSASLHLGSNMNPPEVLDLAATLPGAVRVNENRVNLSRKKVDLHRAFETLGR
jgi:hypothetical protein